MVESDDDPFALRLWRAADGATLLDTTATRLVFKDQYIELTTWLHETVSLYGAGERASDALRLRRNGLPRAIWARDLGPTFLESNSYGSHPFVLALAPGGPAAAPRAMMMRAWQILRADTNCCMVLQTAPPLASSCSVPAGLRSCLPRTG